MGTRKDRIILVIEDDDDDFFLLRKAFSETCPDTNLYRKKDGGEALDYLSGVKTEEEPWIEPSLIFLDLNLPKKDGREILKVIKSHPQFKKTPVIVFSTSKAIEDIKDSYSSGAACYLNKPSGYSALVKIVKNLCEFWFKIALLPA